MSRRLFEKARRLLSQEHPLLPLPDFKDRRGGLSIALAYLNRYYTAMSNLGFQAVYWLFNQEPGTSCQRVFLPDPEDIPEYRRTDTPLFSLESQQPVRSFDILAFSVSYENDYPHLLTMMDLAGIPLLRKDRNEADPLVLAGGASILMNPEPLADFVDFFVIGEAEETIGPLAHSLRKGREKGLSKETRLHDLAGLEGLYVPQFYDVAYRPDGTIDFFMAQKDFPPRVKKVWLKDLNASVTVSPIVTSNTELSNMLLLELSRGCRRGCRFCAGCYAYFPYRHRDAGLLEKAAVQGKGLAEKVGLVGAAISDYPGILPLGRRILQEEIPLSFSSLRVDSLSPELADLAFRSGQRTVTLAPEAGSERMRRVIKKGFTEETILKAVEILAERGFNTFRLYFMVGLPQESKEDVKGIIDLTRKVQHHALVRSPGKKKAERITVSLNSFVPKPTTPFQWHPFDDLSGLNEKMKWVKEGFRKDRNIIVTADLPKWAYLQTVLSRGDRRVGKLLLTAHKLGGNWPQAYRSVDLNPDFYVYRPRTFEEILPWDFIDPGMKKEFLWEEYQKALQEGRKG
ncbi:MAG: TIGR03960 family B12-binding radical SAM protein [Syntrophaceae bacterium]|nr:TIGR03960 family B12-binding radical SAM protein [Syntrophaceae bacterium]